MKSLSVLLLVLAGLTPALADSQLAQAGPVGLTLASLPDLTAELKARAALARGIPWSADDGEFTAEPQALRAAIIDGLERWVVRGEAVERHLWPSLTEVEARLPEGFADDDAARRVVVDALMAEALVEALVAEQALEPLWRARNTQVRLKVLEIPRVPTAQEIDEAVRTQQAAIKVYYTAHPELFIRPAALLGEELLVSADVGEAHLKAVAFQAGAGADAPSLAALGVKVKPFKVPVARADQALAALSVGQVSSPTRVKEGWSMLRLTARLEGSERLLSDPLVQREAAAAVLRERDELPKARATAELGRRLLKVGDQAALASLVATERLRLTETAALRPAGPPVIPGVGLAPAVFQEALTLTAAAPVGVVHRVRQTYVVVRLEGRTEPSQEFSAVEAAFAATIARDEGRRVQEEWLSARLKDEALWIDLEGIQRAIKGE